MKNSSTSKKPISTKTTNADCPPADPDLIITRGLKEMLEKEQRKKGVVPSGPSKKPLGRAPKTINCYLCGRGFGTTSIGIHRPQCYLKRRIAWERGELMTCPVDPETHERNMQERIDALRAKDGKGSQATIVGKQAKKYSNDDWDMYAQLQSDVAYEPCPHCGRTFLPERLEVHLRSCRPGNTAKPVRGKTAGTTAPVETTTTAANKTASSTPAGLAAVEHKDASLEKKERGERKPYVGKPNLKSTLVREGFEEEENVMIAFESGEVRNGIMVRHTVMEKKVYRPEYEPEPPMPPSPPANARKKHADPQRMTASSSSAVKPSKVKPTIRTATTNEVHQSEIVAYESGEMKDGVMIRHTVLEKPEGSPMSATITDVREVSPVKKTASATKKKTISSTNRKQPAAPVNQDEKPYVPPSKPRLASGPEPSSSLVGCHHCGRTFHPARIAKHESCCAERDKPAKVTQVAKPSVSSPPAKGAGKEKVRLNQATVLRRKAAASFEVAYCGDCGAKLHKPGQVFCSACGMKTV